MYALQLDNNYFKPTIGPVEVHNVLLKIGIPPNLLGYNYIVTATELILNNPLYLHTITKGLYVEIARRYGTTSAGVERAIRNAINVGWLHGDLDYIYQLFKNCISPKRGVPSNSLFLTRLFHYFNSVEFE